MMGIDEKNEGSVLIQARSTSGVTRWIAAIALVLLSLGVTAGEGVAVAALALCGLAAAAHAIETALKGGRITAALPWPPAFSVMALFIALSLLSYLWAYPKPDMTDYARVYDLLAVFFVGWAAIAASEKGRRAALWVWVVFVGLGSAFAIFQHYKLLEIDYLARYKIGFYRIMEPAPGGGYMAGGFLFHRLRLSNLLSIAIPLMGFMAVKAKGAFRAVLAVSIVLSIPAMVFCYARTQMAAMFAGIAITLVAMAASRWRVTGGRTFLAAGALLVVLAVVVILMPGVQERYSQQGLSDRKAIWMASLDAVRERPVEGHGYGTAANHLAGRLQGGLQGFSAYCHNQFLTVWLTLGIPGLLLWIVFWAFAIGCAFQAMQRNPATAGLLSGLVSLQMISIFHDPFFHPVSGITCASAASLAIMIGTTGKSPVGKGS